MAEAVKPRPASTILLLRDAPAQREIEVFMMVRHYEIDFNSGALVFPGGSVDKGDNEIIANPQLYSGGEGMEQGELSFRIAAIRETFEESGILLARPKGSKALVDAKRAGEIEAAHRTSLCEGKTTFLSALNDSGMVLALDELVPYAHWITLGKQGSVKAALDDSRGKNVVTVTPVMTKTATGRQLRIPIEAGYDGDVFDVGSVG